MTKAIIPKTPEVIAPKETLTILEKKDRNTIEYWIDVSKQWYKRFKDEQKDRQAAEQDAEVARGLLNEYTNLYNAGYRQKSEVKRLSDDMYDSELAACNEIDGAFASRRKFEFKFTMWIAITIIAGLFIWQYSSNPSFQAGVKEIAPYAVVGVIGLIIAYFAIFKNRR
jgi:hypothetical protein